MRKLVYSGNELSITNPKLVEEWDFEKNYPLTPDDVTFGSNRKVWWKCKKCGYEWETSINHRVHGRGCPLCAKKTVVSGVNDLASMHPEILDEWNYEKNTIKPQEISSGSNKSVWWKCKNHGHVWSASPYTRLKGVGCPVCSNKVVLKGFNDLKTVCPELASEWNYEKNIVAPTEVVFRSERKVWWKCKNCGNEWQAVISSRYYGRGCPECAKNVRAQTLSKTYAKLNNLSTNYPEIAKQWHPIKNGGMLPNMVSSRSNKKVWWLCPVCGNEWQATPNTRTSGCGCAVCAGRKVKVGFNDLATTDPDLAKQWSYEKNEELTPQMITRGSHKKVWWKCQTCGNEWESTIHNRRAGNGCPVCGMKKARKTQQLQTAKKNNLAKEYPDIANEWNYEKNDEPPENYACSSNKKVWWKCNNCLHEWQAVISDRTRYHHGCPKCNMYGTSFAEQAIFFYLKHSFDDAENRFVINGYEFDVFIPSINTAVEYDGVFYHNNLKSLNKDNKKDNYCIKNGIRLIRIRDNKMTNTDYAEIISCKDANDKDLQKAIEELFILLSVDNVPVSLERDRYIILSDYHKSVVKNSIISLNPEIAKEWNYEKNYPLTPDKVLCGSNQIVWWKCEKGHEWRASVNNRAGRNHGCPYCSNQKVLAGYNDLATTNPKLANEWDYNKNELRPTDITAGSNKSFWWKCSKCGNEWKAKVARRSNGSGCPVCMLKQSRINMRISKAKANNLVENYPKIASEWDYHKNEEPPENYASNSNYRAHWICHYCGKEYETKIQHRVLNGDRMGCVSCRRKHKTSKKC